LISIIDFPVWHNGDGARRDRSNRWLGSALGNVNISDPVPLPTRQTCLWRLSVKIDGLPTQMQRVKVLKCVDIDNGVDMIRNVTRDNRNRATADTNVKRRGLSSKRVP
jgi:hypothetical protein